MSNWQLGQKVMFLAEYWAKTADPAPVSITVGGVPGTVTVGQALQRGAEMCGNSIQWWKQPAQHSNGFSPEYAQVAGMCSHGGVTGDYMHQGWYCGINICGVYSFNGMAFARRAGMDMGVKPRDGHYFGYNLNQGDTIPAAISNALPASITLPQYGADAALGSTINDPFWYDPSIHQKFAMQLNFLVRRSAWYSAGNNDDGVVGYAPESITSYDAGGRTPGALLGMAMFNQDVGGLDTADQNRMESLKGYITRNYMRHQEAHAYCVGAQAYQALCAPYLSDRQQRFFMDNWRFFFALSRTASNGIQYFPSRSVADNYLDTNHCASLNIALPYAIANGAYTLVPGYNTNRTLANFKSPFLMWPSLAARACTVTSGTQDFQVDICDGNGNPLDPSAYSVAWSHVSGPATATFGSASTANTTVTFPSVSATPYRIRLTVTRPGIPDLTEDIDVTRANAPTPVPNAIATQPVSRVGVPGGNATFTVGVTGDGPFVYEWKLNGTAYWGVTPNPTLSLSNISAGLAGTYVCTVHTPTGPLTANAATLTIPVVSTLTAGGLKREVWNSLSGGTVANLTGSSRYPLFPDATSVASSVETASGYGDNYGERYCGWIIPPATGQYKFYIASDDASEVWLSTNESAANKAKICQVTGWTNYRAYSSGGQSALINLTAGQRYYLEILHKEGGGGDHLSLAWQLPGGSAPANGSDPIGPDYLQYEALSADPNLTGLVSWWKMDEGTGTLAADVLATANDGTLGAPVWVSGKRGGALAFDGNDRITCSNLGALGGTTPFTVAAWVKVDAGANADAVVIQQRAANGYNGQYQLKVTAAGKPGFYVYGNGAEQFNFAGATSINDGQWHHIAGVRDASGNASIYLDGAVDGSVTGTTVRSLSSSINIGIGCDIRDSNKYFRGSIDDVRVYSRVLDAAEIAAIRNRAPSFPSDPIAGAAATEDAAYSGSVSATDPEGETVSYNKVSGPSWLVVSATGALGGIPANADVGPNSFTIAASDTSGGVTSVTLDIAVSNVNDAPVWTSDPINANATEDAAFAGQLAATDADAGDVLTYSKVAGPAWLTVSPAGALGGTPANGDVGANVFTVRVSDGTAAVDATLNVAVSNTNDAPVWTADPINANATEDAAFTGQLAATDVDAGDVLTYSKVAGPAWLTVSPAGALGGTPANGDVGANVFTVRVSDGTAAVDATLNVTVSNTNDAPVWTVNPITTANATEGVPYTGQTLAGKATDADPGDTVTYSKVSGPAWLAVAANGNLTGTPASGSAGPNAFVVRATDGAGATADAQLQITVIGLPLPWATGDIGTGMLAGSATYSGGTFTQAGSGTVGGTSDRLRFTYQTLTGDGEIIARITSLQNTGTSSRVGVMIRDTLANNSKQVFIGLTGTGSYRWAYRTSTGGSTTTSNSSTGTVPNTWIRLTRVGTTITAYKSTNGTSWTTVGSRTVTMASNCYIGLAVASGSTTTLNTSQFSSVSVTP